MDWQTIITSVLSTSVIIVPLTIFVVKKWVEKSFNRKLEEDREEIRRKGEIYDIQRDVYLVFISLIYRARNAARDIKYEIEKEDVSDHEELARMTRRLASFNDTLIEMLYENRAVLNGRIFGDIHELKYLIPDFIKIADTVATQRMNNRPNDSYYYIDQCRWLFKEIDGQYESINAFIQRKLYIE